MFQYAAGRALAHKLGTELKLDLSLLCSRGVDGKDTYRAYELDAFNIQASMATDSEVHRFNPVSTGILERLGRRVVRVISRPSVYIEQTRGFDKALSEQPDDTCIVGAFQSAHFFTDIKDLIRQEFTFKAAPALSATGLFDEIQKVNAVAIHVRRGDYVSSAKYSQTLGAKGTAYYKKAFKRIEESLVNPVGFLFSDDVAWCKANIQSPFPLRYVSEEESTQAWKDLFFMSSCKHFIIPNSTFSWWGAWLGQDPDKRVLAPAKWSSNGSLESEDRIPDGWIKI